MQHILQKVKLWTGSAKLLKPQKVSVTGLILLLLCIGILAKLCIAWYVERLNKRISSSALKAVQKDNISDAMVTAVTLAGIMSAPFVTLTVNEVLGIFVSMVILYSGIRFFVENFTLLLGKGAVRKKFWILFMTICPPDLQKESSFMTMGRRTDWFLSGSIIPLRPKLIPIKKLCLLSGRLSGRNCR